MKDKQYMDMILETYLPDTEEDILFCILGLAGEVGEVANLGAKLMRGDFDEEEFMEQGDKRKQIIGELGGVMYYLRALMWKLHTTPEQIMGANAAKLRSRAKRGVIRGDGDER
jgi:NTP pyrophosphatase (non-canonical NTP hydrolase)